MRWEGWLRRAEGKGGWVGNGGLLRYDQVLLDGESAPGRRGVGFFGHGRVAWSKGPMEGGIC